MLLIQQPYYWVILAIQISKHPHGDPKATTYVAFINSLILLVVTAIVIFGGVTA